MKIREIASGLQFPEGPVAMSDGSVVLVEIARGTLSRVTPDGHIHVLATLGGGPNGAAIGPDGAVYICNNGGFRYTSNPGGCLRPIGQADDYSGGRIERVNLATGRIDRLFDEADGLTLRGPNDLVFDAHGGFYFTDLGKVREQDMDRGGLFYAMPGAQGAQRARDFGHSMSRVLARCASCHGPHRKVHDWWPPHPAGTTSASTRWRWMPLAICLWPPCCMEGSP